MESHDRDLLDALGNSDLCQIGVREDTFSQLCQGAGQCGNKAGGDVRVCANAFFVGLSSVVERTHSNGGHAFRDGDLWHSDIGKCFPSDGRQG